MNGTVEHRLGELTEIVANILIRERAIELETNKRSEEIGQFASMTLAQGIPIKIERKTVTPANVVYEIIRDALNGGDINTAKELGPLLNALVNYERNV